MAPLRAAVIGFGLSGSTFHAPLIAATPGLTVSSVVTGDPRRQADARRRCPGAEIFSSVAELWSRAADHDVVVVASPNSAHVEQAAGALELGLAVVVDKPLALTAAEARPLLAQATASGSLLTVFQNRRWDSDHLTVRRLLREGALGEVLRYESRFERFRPELKAGEVWRELSPPELGGGVLLDLGSHLVDQALTLFGPVSDVYGELESRRGGAADDHGFASLRHEGSVRSHLSVSALAGAPGPRLRILGRRGAYVHEALDGQEEALRSGRTPGESWGAEPEERWGTLERDPRRQSVPSEPGAWPTFYLRLVSALRDDGPVPVDPRDAVRTLEVLDAVRDSAGRGSVVALGP